MRRLWVHPFLLFIYFCSIFCASAQEQVPVQSPPQKTMGEIVFSKRDAKESWRLLAEKFKVVPAAPVEPVPVPPPADPLPPPPAKTAFDIRVPGAQLVVPEVPTVDSQEELVKFFEYARDTRYLKDPQTAFETFLRRIPWLFPDDGCFMRAYLVNELLKKDLQQETGRAFVFGDLWVESAQAPQRIHWWYHTAATLKLHDIVYVIDVAIDATQALPLKEWVNKQNVIFETAEVSLCEASTYFPNQSCQRSGPDAEMVPDHLTKYLNAERERQVQLHQAENPAVVDAILGEKPPWRTL